jgi:hypothetical protein
MGLQQLSEVEAGPFLLLGYAGQLRSRPRGSTALAARVSELLMR